MDECHNVINFGDFDTINVDDATVCKMVKKFISLIYTYFLGLKHEALIWAKYWFFSLAFDFKEKMSSCE